MNISYSKSSLKYLFKLEKCSQDFIEFVLAGDHDSIKDFLKNR
jgi:hypothetical protein